MQDMLQNKTQVETVNFRQNIILSDDDFEIRSKISRVGSSEVIVARYCSELQF